MKKKLSLILLALALVFAIAACGDTASTPAPDTDANYDTTTDAAPELANPEEKAFEIYNNIMQMLSLDAGQSGAFDIDFVMDMDMSVFGEAIHSVSTGNMQMIVDGDNAQLAMTMITDMSEFGMDPMVMEVFMTVEDNLATELRMTLDGEDLSEMLPLEMLEDMVDNMLEDAISMPEFGIEAFQSAEITEIGNNTSIHMVLDGQELSSFISSAMDDSLEMLVGLNLDMSFDFSDVVITLLIDADENPISMTLEMEMTMGFGEDLADELEELAGEEMFIRSVIEYTFNAFGDNVEITLA